LSFSARACLILYPLAGFDYLTAAGKDDKIKSAKNKAHLRGIASPSRSWQGALSGHRGFHQVIVIQKNKNPGPMVRGFEFVLI
jgi:hypothetical protein